MKAIFPLIALLILTSCGKKNSTDTADSVPTGSVNVEAPTAIDFNIVETYSHTNILKITEEIKYKVDERTSRLEKYRLFLASLSSSLKHAEFNTRTLVGAIQNISNSSSDTEVFLHEARKQHLSYNILFPIKRAQEIKRSYKGLLSDIPEVVRELELGFSIFEDGLYERTKRVYSKISGHYKGIENFYISAKREIEGDIIALTGSDEIESKIIVTNTLKKLNNYSNWLLDRVSDQEIRTEEERDSKLLEVNLFKAVAKTICKKLGNSSLIEQELLLNLSYAEKLIRSKEVVTQDDSSAAISEYKIDINSLVIDQFDGNVLGDKFRSEYQKFEEYKSSFIKIYGVATYNKLNKGNVLNRLEQSEAKYLRTISTIQTIHRDIKNFSESNSIQQNSEDILNFNPYTSQLPQDTYRKDLIICAFIEEASKQKDINAVQFKLTQSTLLINLDAGINLVYDEVYENINQLNETCATNSTDIFSEISKLKFPWLYNILR